MVIRGDDGRFHHTVSLLGRGPYCHRMPQLLGGEPAVSSEEGRIHYTAVRKYSAGPHNLLEKSYKRGKAPEEL